MQRPRRMSATRSGSKSVFSIHVPYTSFYEWHRQCLCHAMDSRPSVRHHTLRLKEAGGFSAALELVSGFPFCEPARAGDGGRAGDPAETRAVSQPLWHPALSLECSLTGRPGFRIIQVLSVLPGGRPSLVITSEQPKRSSVNGHFSSL